VERAYPTLHTATSVEDASRGAHLVLVLTEWDEFRSLDPVALADVVAHRRVIDGRLLLDPEKWRAAGWELYALGRGSR
jgi:UDPglucose 6-dehydrogenase